MNHILTSRLCQRNDGFTLVEGMVASCIALFILTGVLTTYIQLTKNLTAVSNYTQIHSDGRIAVEWFAKDIRAVNGISSYSSNNLTVLIPTNFSSSGVILGTKSVQYAYSNGALTRYDSSTGRTDLLATNIYQLTYYLYDHAGNITTLTNNAKSVQVDIKLRKYVGSQIQSEDFLSGRYVMRNK